MRYSPEVKKWRPTLTKHLTDIEGVTRAPTPTPVVLERVLADLPKAKASLPAADVESLLVLTRQA
eukprot:507061-Pyramimonas_sp.AAC.1